MKRGLLIISFLVFYNVNTIGQAAWHLLTSSPTESFRHDDVYFINADIGWVVNVSGQVWKTLNGGISWNLVESQNTSFRCVGFLDTARGFIGNLGPGRWAPTLDTVPLYQTIDGGITWTRVTNIIGPIPKGICGMRIVNDSVIVACGRVDGPPYFVRSTDAGKTWYSKDMSSYAGMLIDLCFTSTDTGFVVGGTKDTDVVSQSLILYTTDGGSTWTKKIQGAALGDHCWKIDHPSKKMFYASVEQQTASDTLKYFNSTDGGITWKENVMSNCLYGFSQGIGFLNDTVGWNGGDTYALSTTDGGKTFNKMNPRNILVSLNRIRFVNDSIGYAVGQRIYKYYNLHILGIQENTDFTGYDLKQNQPNPFSESTTVTYTIPRPEHVLLEVFDDAGRKITTLVNEQKQAGTYSVKFTLPHKGSGSFICAINAGLYGKRIKMVAIDK